MSRQIVQTESGNTYYEVYPKGNERLLGYIFTRLRKNKGMVNYALDIGVDPRTYAGIGSGHLTGNHIAARFRDKLFRGMPKDSPFTEEDIMAADGYINVKYIDSLKRVRENSCVKDYHADVKDNIENKKELISRTCNSMRNKKTSKVAKTTYKSYKLRKKEPVSEHLNELDSLAALANNMILDTEEASSESDFFFATGTDNVPVAVKEIEPSRDNITSIEDYRQMVEKEAEFKYQESDDFISFIDKISLFATLLTTEQFRQVRRELYNLFRSNTFNKLLDLFYETFTFEEKENMKKMIKYFLDGKPYDIPKLSNESKIYYALICNVLF